MTDAKIRAIKRRLAALERRSAAARDDVLYDMSMLTDAQFEELHELYRVMGFFEPGPDAGPTEQEAPSLLSAAQRKRLAALIDLIFAHNLEQHPAALAGIPEQHNE